MNTYKKLSNSFLVYSFVFVSMVIFIIGVISVFKFVQEAGQTGIPAALMEQIVALGLGVICLSLAAPCYRLLTSLKILHLKSSQTGAPALVPYTPFFISDMLEADEEINIRDLQNVHQNPYFKRLITLKIDEGGELQTIRSFVKPDSLALLPKP